MKEREEKEDGIVLFGEAASLISSAEATLKNTLTSIGGGLRASYYLKKHTG